MKLERNLKFYAGKCLKLPRFHYITLLVKELDELVNKDNDIKEHLSEWLKWWTSRKEHIFRAFKLTTAPASNLAEVIHSQWVSARKTHFSIYDAAVDDITEHITTKQMLRQFKDGGFIGGTGPSISTLQRTYVCQTRQHFVNYHTATEF